MLDDSLSHKKKWTFEVFMMFLPPQFIRFAELPSPSPVIANLLDLLYRRNTEIDDLTSIMSTDAALTAKVIRSSNAAFSSPVSKIDNIHDAVIRIGLIQTIHIITATEISSVFYSVPLPYGDTHELLRHNVLVACLADSYARYIGSNNPGKWFTAGLLHDIGRLILIANSPNKYRDCMIRSKNDGVDLREAEQESFGYSHDIAGGYLLTFWGFPQDIADAATDHHCEFVSHHHAGSGIGICNLIAKDPSIIDSPGLHGIPTERLIADAASKYEAMIKTINI